MSHSARKDAGSQEGWGTMAGFWDLRGIDNRSVGKNNKHGCCHSCGCPKSRMVLEPKNGLGGRREEEWTERLEGHVLVPQHS